MANIRALLLVSMVTAACETTAPTEAFVRNEFAPGSEAPVVKKAWFRTTLFSDRVEPGGESQSLRIGPGTERAYAIVEVGSRSFVVVSRDVLTPEIGERTPVVFSTASSVGTCFTDARLSREDYDFVTSRIFPGDAVEPFDAPCDAPKPASDAGDGG